MHTTVFVTDIKNGKAGRMETFTFINGDELLCNVDVRSNGTCSLIGSSQHMRMLAERLLSVANEADARSRDS